MRSNCSCTSRAANSWWRVRAVTASSSPRTKCSPYARLVWAMVAVGILIIATGLTQPLVLLIIAACVAAFSMFIYSALLIVLNRRLLPLPLRPRLYRTLSLVWATGLFGILSAITLVDQARKLFGG